MSLTNSQYAQIMREYDNRQQKNRHILRQRKNDLYQELPRLKEIEEEIADISLSHAARMIEGDAGASGQLKEKLAVLRQERARIFKKLRLPDDYLTSCYECPDCRDTGYIGSKKCHCFQQAAINLIYTQSNMQHILKEENFSYYSFSYYSDGETDPITGLTPLAAAHAAYQTAQTFIREFDNSFHNLFIYGDTGVGKTFLSNCIAKELLDSGHSVIYFTAYELFDIFSKNVFDKDADAIEANRHIFDCDLLLIDDLGTELTNGFHSSQLFLCINERILRRKSTIISTNLRLQKIADLYSERTLSRITSCYDIIKLSGADIRIQKKIQ
ncbi:MAG: ATP-binding protein [Eubacterium sp.]|nr:ATP-binding protein [Eubacterium sp.]